MERLRNQANTEYDSTTSPLAQDNLLLAQLREKGAEHFLDLDSSADIWEKLTRHCCICNQWCSSARAVAFHLQSKHAKFYSQSRAWASRRIKARVLEVTNPCKWCKASFSESTVLSGHNCLVVVQAGILEQLALVEDVEDRTSEPSEGHGCSLSGSGCVRRTATPHGRQQQTASRRRPAGVGPFQASFSKETAQQQPQERAEKHIQQHGPVEYQHESTTSSSRRCAKQIAARCGVQSTSSNYRAYSAGAFEGVAKMERRQRGRQVEYRSTFENFAGGVLLPRTPWVHEKDRGGIWRECGLQAACLRWRDLAGQDLLQDKVGCDGAEGLQHRSKSSPARSSSSIREHGSMDGVAISSSQIPQHKTHGRSVQRQVLDFLAGAELTGCALDGSVPLSWGARRDNNLGNHAMSLAEGDAAKKSVSGRVAEAPRGSRLMTTSSSTTTSLLPSSSSQVRSTSPTTAFRTWMQHGRSLFPIPRLQNNGNQCYRNAALTALVVCHHFVSIPSEQWGCIACIAAAAKRDWHGLSSIAEFQRAQQNWADPEIQHDVYEYLSHLEKSIPAVSTPRAEARFLSENGVVREECLCALAPQEANLSFQDHMLQWHSASGVIKALLAAPLVLCIQLVRFEYVDRHLRRQSATVSPEPSEIELPVFSNGHDISVHFIRYRCTACILHQGASPTSGHYRTLVYCDGGYVVADDAKFGEFWATPSEDDLSQIYVLLLVRLD